MVVSELKNSNVFAELGSRINCCDNATTMFYE